MFYQTIKVLKKYLFIVSFIAMLPAFAAAQVQSVSGTLEVAELSAGQSTNLTVTYSASDADGNAVATTGLGLRLHYDSSVLEMGAYSERLFAGSQPFQFKDDTTDLDNDDLVPSIEWLVNGNVQSTDLALDTSSLQIGDTIEVSCSVADGIENSETMVSAPIAISSRQPSIDQIQFFPTNPTPSHHFAYF